MQLLLTGSTDPYLNLAIEEYLMKYSDDDYFMLWQNAPTVVIGKNQDLYTEVDIDQTAARGVTVSRRITGGGAVYHDLGNVNYSFITSRTKARALDFAYFTRPVIEALESMGLSVRLSGRNDLLVDVNGEEMPAKVSGNAQAATETRILHHGTLLFDSDLEVLSKVLKPAPEKLRSKGIASVRSRVTNLRAALPEGKDCSTEEFFARLVAFAEEKWQTRASVFPAGNPVVESLRVRNASEAYLAGRREDYDFSARTRTPGGTVCLLWSLDGDMISKFRIEGDFFGELPTEKLEQALCGRCFDRKSIHLAASACPIEQVVGGWTEEGFMELLGLGDEA